jgi:hypothetical protein
MNSRGFFDVMKDTFAEIAPGLKNASAEFGAELSRLGKQGAIEMAQALFNGAGFTPYGPGQYTATPEVGKGNGHEVHHSEPQHEHGGREM